MRTRRALVLAFPVLLAVAFEPAHAQRTKTDHQIAYYQTLLERNPRSAKTYFGLGDALIRKARETGDQSYFSRAEQALKKSLAIMPQNGGALRHLAYVFYSRHEFALAAAYARKAVEINPADADSYGVLGDALLEVGQYAEAQAAYSTMIELDESLYSYSRLAGLKSMRGDAAGAINDLKRAMAAGKALTQPAESIAWAEWQLGSDYFAIGNLQEAENYYQQSLKTYPNYYRSLAGMAQVRAAQKRYDDAIELYRKAMAILPMPEYAAALGDIYSKIEQPEKTRQQYELVEYIGKLSDVRDGRERPLLYNREMAYFYADHDIKVSAALDLARRELDYRKDVYAYDLLAWSLHKNNKNEEARDAIEKALRLGTKDAKLFYHAGMIYRALGAKEKAAEFLSRAIHTNPHFHPIFADSAGRTLKQLESEIQQARATREGEHDEG
ncbi:MAG: tetratricopeptide repeat protein [Candidatus Binatia bacterium]